jgi:AAA family ATP:ADP antiporter
MNNVPSRVFKSLAAIEPQEIRAVFLSLLYFFCLFGSYSVLKPVRDAMGTVYGMKHIQELFTGTFVASFCLRRSIQDWPPA